MANSLKKFSWLMIYSKIFHSISYIYAIIISNLFPPLPFLITSPSWELFPMSLPSTFKSGSDLMILTSSMLDSDSQGQYLDFLLHHFVYGV